MHIHTSTDVIEFIILHGYAARRAACCLAPIMLDTKYPEKPGALNQFRAPAKGQMGGLSSNFPRAWISVQGPVNQFRFAWPCRPPSNFAARKIPVNPPLPRVALYSVLL